MKAAGLSAHRSSLVLNGGGGTRKVEDLDANRVEALSEKDLHALQLNPPLFNKGEFRPTGIRRRKGKHERRKSEATLIAVL